MAIEGQETTAPEWIDWNVTIKKEARGIGDFDLGEVQDVGASYIHTQKGIAKKEQFYIPKYLVEGFDGNTLWFKVSEAQAQEMIRETPPDDAEYRTRYGSPDTSGDIEQRMPRISPRVVNERNPSGTDRLSKDENSAQPNGTAEEVD